MSEFLRQTPSGQVQSSEQVKHLPIERDRVDKRMTARELWQEMKHNNPLIGDLLSVNYSSPEKRNQVAMSSQVLSIRDMIFNPSNGGDYDTLHPLQHLLAVPTVDMEVVPRQDTHIQLLEQLSSMGQEGFLLDSGGSFHFVFNTVVHPEDTPHYWSMAVNSTTDKDNPLNHELKGFSDALARTVGNPSEMRKLAGQILDKFGHVQSDQPPSYNGLVTTVDMRWIGHSLEELADTLEGGRLIYFGGLRITSGNYPGPPEVVGEIQQSKIVVYDQVGGGVLENFRDHQRELQPKLL